MPLALLTACNSKDAVTEEVTPAPWDPVNEKVKLYAGIAEGGQQVMTRAGAEDSHDIHKTLGAGTKVALRVSGTWTGHDPVAVVKTTTGTVEGVKEGTDNKHNILSCNPVLNWDDYGTADPANAETGRAQGLTVYGAAIDGKTTLPTVLTNIADWTALSWTLSDNQSQANETPADKDLLISNNVRTATAGASYQYDCGTYLFTERTSGKLLEFRHALSRITFNLRAGEGFTGGVFDTTTAEEVKLTSNETGGTLDEWPILSGAVNITTGDVDITTPTRGTVIMNQTATPTTGWTVTKEALVMPGSEFLTDAAVIARINADDNIYYVTAAKIRAAISTAGLITDGHYLTQPGKNYIINVIINKTDISVTATITDWIDVEAEDEAPVINVDAAFGAIGSPTPNAFSFYRSTSLYDGYSTGNAVGIYYPSESSVSYTADKDNDGNPDGWLMAPKLYWPTHNTHYQFRGVWPQTVTETGVQSYPRVEAVTQGATTYQVIKVSNVPYAVGTFPSDLMIARPEIDASLQCTNIEPGHAKTYLYSGGICATEGDINLNFRYMMSQVEVHLFTSGATATDRVNLDGAVVELVNVYNTGNVKLGDREVLFLTGTDTKGNYTLDAVDGTGNENKRWSAIVPQNLTYTTAQAAGNVKFRITITNTDSSTDVYYADLQPIKVLEAGSAGPAAAINAWESGHHYIYSLTLTKTEVKVTATLTDWITVNANENVWF